MILKTHVGNTNWRSSFVDGGHDDKGSTNKGGNQLGRGQDNNPRAS